MARTKTFKVDDIMADDTRMNFCVMPDQFAIANGVVADPNNVTPHEKLFLETRMVMTNDLDSTTEIEGASSWQQVTPAKFPGMHPQFISFLTGMFTSRRDAKGLKPKA